MACIYELLTDILGRCTIHCILGVVLVRVAGICAECFARPTSQSVPHFICFRFWLPNTHHVGPEVPFLMIGLD
jgi:hypothetical protein